MPQYFEFYNKFYIKRKLSYSMVIYKNLAWVIEKSPVKSCKRRGYYP